jgi:hypothetical protein
MITMQTIVYIIGSLPFGIQVVYSLWTTNTSKDSFRLAQETLFKTLSRLFYYVAFAAPFYIYVLSSKQIRTTLREIIIPRHLRSVTNTVQPIEMKITTVAVRSKE